MLRPSQMKTFYYPSWHFLVQKTPEQRVNLCWKLTIKTPERSQWHRSGVFTVKEPSDDLNEWNISVSHLLPSKA